jgi:hypothetical protein
MKKVSKRFSFCLDQAISNDHFTQIYARASMYVVIAIPPMHMHIHTICCAHAFTPVLGTRDSYHSCSAVARIQETRNVFGSPDLERRKYTSILVC